MEAQEKDPRANAERSNEGGRKDVEDVSIVELHPSICTDLNPPFRSRRGRKEKRRGGGSKKMSICDGFNRLALFGLGKLPLPRLSRVMIIKWMPRGFIYNSFTFHRCIQIHV